MPARLPILVTPCFALAPLKEPASPHVASSPPPTGTTPAHAHPTAPVMPEEVVSGEVAGPHSGIQCTHTPHVASTRRPRPCHLERSPSFGPRPCDPERSPSFGRPCHPERSPSFGRSEGSRPGQTRPATVSVNETEILHSVLKDIISGS